jgi:chromosomal replication initiation ATPase DnaA
MKEEKLNNLAELMKDISGYDIRVTRGRPQKYVRPKAAIAVVAANWYGINLTNIGHFLNWKDHTVVCHHRKNHKGRYRSDYEYAEMYDEVMRRISSPETDQFASVISMLKEIADT